MKRTNTILALSALLLLGACKKDDAPAVTQYQLVADSSSAVWKGFLRSGYFNEGSIRVESQNITMSAGMISGGGFRMPLSSIRNFNLPTEELKTELINHLRSADFFNMALHPEVSFEISSVSAYNGGTAEAVAGASHTIKGQLSILGKPLEISFPARITSSGDKLDVAAVLKVDRSRWGMNYAADPSLPEDKHILPEIAIELKLKGVKK